MSNRNIGNKEIRDLGRRRSGISTQIQKEANPNQVKRERNKRMGFAQDF